MCEEQSFRSRKCDICTGCGRCDAGGKGADVVDSMPLFGAGGVRAAAPSCKERGLFVTADIGTTTIAMQLHDEEGRVLDRFARLNPQARYGVDVLSRIRAAGEVCGAAEEMQRQVQEVLREGIGRFLRDKQALPIRRMILAANTTMVYLLMGWDAGELGHAPFCVSHPQPVEWELEGIPVYVFPPLSAFVGGDITAGILACGITESRGTQLLIDLGTNGEIVLGNEERLLACSTAAGPAFEGGVNRGVWGADMVSLIAKLRRAGAVDETGLLREGFFDRGVRIEGVLVTQQAIRAIQLAKGAIMAGIRILTDRFGAEADRLERVVLAGGFGYYLNPRDAAEIGLLPDFLADRTVTGGNTALTGATLVGLQGWERDYFWQSDHFLPELLNLAEASEFENLYISSMGLERL